MISKEDLKQLIKSIQDATGLGQEDISIEAGYKARTLTEILSKGDRLESAYKRLEITFKDRLKKTMSDGDVRNERFTADQLFAMFLEVSGTQTAILRSIESKMAQESTQAKMMEQTTWITFSLQDVSQKVTTLWERQHMAIEEIREQFAKLGVERIPASGGAHKKRGQNGGSV